jgi:DegV family protein with EDD domain
MAAVRIVTDSACDLPQEVVDQFGIEIVPLTIRFGAEEFVDRFDLSAESFYEKMATADVLPETAAPAPGQFQEVFSRLADDGADAVICVNLSSELSATMASAQNAAKALDGRCDVRVVDSRSITGGQGTMVRKAAELAADGAGANEVVALIDDLAARTRLYGALDTLENLKKGGRIGGAQAALGSLLSIKPIIHIGPAGKVEEAGKQRTRKKALVWLRDKLFETEKVENLTVCSGMAPDVDELLDLLSPRFSRSDINTFTIGATIGAHGGPRVIGLTWQDAP